MSATRSPGASVFVLAVLSAGALSYATIRAIRIPIVHDEAITHLLFVAGRWAGSLDPRAPFPENNHYLNSVLSAAAWKTFGGRELSLRLPSLLAYVLFLASTARLSLRQTRGPLIVAAFLLLNANPFVMEFFSLSRGYGLGLAFLAAGVSLLVSALERPRKAAVAASLGIFCFGLAALSHLSFLLPLAAGVAAGGARGAFLLFSRRQPPEPDRPAAPSLLIPLLMSVPFFLVLVPYSIELSRAGRFYMGGTHGLWSDSVVSLLAVLRDRPAEEAARAPLLEMAVAIALLFIAATILLRPHFLNPSVIVPAVLLALTAAGVELAARLFDTRYPVERAALPLQFLFLAAVTAAGGDWIIHERSGWRLVSVAVMLAAILAGANFLRTANTTRTLTWRYDADNLLMLDDLDRARRGRGFTRPVRLGITWLMEPSINYYRTERKLEWMLPVGRGGLTEGDPDFVYFTPKDAETARHLNLAPVATYPDSGNQLAARNVAPQRGR
ncbi:MAG: hypothetical protein ACHQPI_02800 [Thermoanaerobaculia bacterium]